jgi:undecaprenyl-diphosphatase
MAQGREHALGRLFFFGLGTAVLALFLFAWISGAMLDGGAGAFDQNVRLSLNAYASPQMTVAMRFFTSFGSPLVLLPLSAAVLAAFWKLGWNREAGLFAATLGGAVVLNFALKLAFQRPRPPDTFFGTPVPDSYSFPSGHALISACFFIGLAVLAAPRLRARASRVAIWLGAVVLALVIGLSRIYLGVHYPSDVLAGYTAAIVWIATVASADRLLQRRARRAPGGPA